MNIAQYLDSTYLKTNEQSGLSDDETFSILLNLTDEAIQNSIFAVMIRPKFVAKIRTYLNEKNSTVQLGTVIGFHEGTNSIDDKLEEAKKAIKDGADELDFVVNYPAFLEGNLELIKSEIISCTQLCLDNHKIAKWIIEIAALNNQEIATLTKLISTTVSEKFPGQENNVFVKSSTGFFVTKNNQPNGATVEGIEIMLKNAGKLPVKAAGGVRTPQEAVKMIEMGVKRIGTSSALALLQNKSLENGY
ncbi:MAG: deoxyribose-phosphate aldolase [Bacteroidetes bacterium]|jgi:deoxyribose-phosphate aldolase|nr:deoxyribose-phosphate aldolase [Bacteroidota bacterium]